MLDATRDDMTFGGRGLDPLVNAGGAADREVIGFGSTAREDDLRRIAADQCRDGAPGIVQYAFRGLAEMMHARRVAENISTDIRNSVGHLRRKGGCRVVV